MSGVYWHLGRDGGLYLVDVAFGNLHNRWGKRIGAVCADGYMRGAGHYVHRAVWEVVHGPIPPTLEINHRNGDKADNRLENLELVTHAENVRHAYALGIYKRGEARSDAKLTEAQVLAARQRVAAGEPVRVLAREFGVDPKTIRLAIRGETWAHLPDAVPAAD